MTAPSEIQHVYLRTFDGQRRNSLSVLAGLVPRDASILDVGTGSGALGRYLSENKSCIVDGLTHNRDEAAMAAPHYRRLNVGDLETQDLAELCAGTRYDIVIFADVLEHLRQPHIPLRAAGALLADGGKVLLSVPNVAYLGLLGELLTGEFRYRDEGLLDRTHLRFFTRRSLLDFLSDNGYQVTRLETVCVDLPQSEFRLSCRELTPAVTRWLAALPDALTYQFIVEAQPLPAGRPADHRSYVTGDRPAVAIHPVALYWRDADGYREDHKVVRWGALGEAMQCLVIDMPATLGAVRGLRLDPSDRPGFLHLRSIELLSPAGVSLWRWDGDAHSLAAARHEQVVFGERAAGGEGIVVLLAGEDPQLELPVPEAVLESIEPHSRLLVHMGWPMSSDYLALAGQLAEKDKALEGLRGELSCSATRLEDLESRLGNTESRLSSTESRLRCAEDELQGLTGELEASRAETASVIAERESLRQHLQFIEQSTVFRLTRPLVRAKMRFDRLIASGPNDAVQPVAAQSVPQPVPAPSRPVDVIVPVYRGLADTRRCLESVLASRPATPLRLVVINDASPEPELRDYLRGLAEADVRVLLIENEHNVGFVGTVNRGMALAAQRDVVLLNSDTEVANDWLDRLRAAAYSDRHVGTVTPFSNNATICSYPRFCDINDLPAGFETAALDRLCAETNPGQRVSIPTGVGFCMYIRRDCLEAVGYFDVDQFGKGYGEENDFCMRAEASGWHHLLAMDTFVRHAGGVSFGDSKKPMEADAFEKVRRLHPRYEPLVREHIASDPARAARLAVDVARMRSTSRPTILFVTHARGGGTERHVRELVASFHGEANSLVLRPANGGAMVLECLAPGEEGFRLWFHLPADFEALCGILAGVGVVHVHFHHLLGLAPDVWGLPRRLDASYDYTAHDYYALCPQISLTGRDNRYCGELGVEQCASCLRQSPAPGGSGILQWRRNYRALLCGARRVFVPSEDAARRLRREFPDAPVIAVPHTDLEEVKLPDPAAPRRLMADAPLRIAVIGALSVIKGADVLEQAALEAARRNAAVEFHLLGYAYRNLATQPKAHLTVHGAYDDADLDALLAWLSPDVVWFPALWPETYSYTLSACLKAGLPIVAPDIGAFPERLAGRAWTWIEPWDRTAGDWLAFFETVRDCNFVAASAPAVAGSAAAAPAAFRYDTDYLKGLDPRNTAPALSTEQLARHAYDRRQGVEAAQAQVKRIALGVVVRLRNARMLSGLARHIPLRWQTRLKTWLMG